jgi:hypothetical protein
MTYTGPERVTSEALTAYRETQSLLHQWAATAHRLVVERVDALLAADPDDVHVTETPREFAERVHAHGQYPFPEGEAIYSDINNNRGYDWVEIGFGVNGEGDEVDYTGWYPVWAPDGESYERRFARIHIPTYVITEPDGAERYRARTAEMVAALKARQAEERARLDEIIAEMVAKYPR